MGDGIGVGIVGLFFSKNSDVLCASELQYSIRKIHFLHNSFSIQSDFSFAPFVWFHSTDSVVVDVFASSSFLFMFSFFLGVNPFYNSEFSYGYFIWS